MLFHFLDPCALQTQRVLNVWTLEPRWELFLYASSFISQSSTKAKVMRIDVAFHACGSRISSLQSQFLINTTGYRQI